MSGDPAERDARLLMRAPLGAREEVRLALIELERLEVADHPSREDAVRVLRAVEVAIRALLDEKEAK